MFTKLKPVCVHRSSGRFLFINLRVTEMKIKINQSLTCGCILCFKNLRFFSERVMEK